MVKCFTPITVFTSDVDEAQAMAAATPNSRAIIGGRGTLGYHYLIAAHGAGDFKTLYVPIGLRDSFRTPVGGEERFTAAADPAVDIRRVA